MEMTVRIIKGETIFIDIAPSEVIEAGMWWGNCGFYVYSPNGMLHTQYDGWFTACENQSIKQGSIVTVKSDAEFNVSFAVEGCCFH